MRQHSSVCIASVLAAASFSAVSAHAYQPLGETHWIEAARMSEPESGDVAFFDRELPLFDTFGGTRELVGIDVYYSVEMLHDETYASNNSGVQIASRFEIHRTWIPTFENGFDEIGYFEGFYAVASAQDPGFEGFTESDINIYNRAWWFGLNNPSTLARFIGTGTTGVQSELRFDTLIVQNPNNPNAFFDPSFIDVYVRELWVDMSFTYIYNVVPTPGVSLVVAGAGLAAVRRRR